jgi:carbon storage regulator
MLVLTRRGGEAIVVGEKVSITILEVRGTQVRIGIEAPKEVSIYRKELYLDIVGANKKAVLIDRERLNTVLSKMRKAEGVEAPEAVGKGAGENGKMD